jgi:signal transduction histidine kinase
VGRLFWKFFFSILLAQVVAAVGIGGAVWLRNRDASAPRQQDIDTGPRAEDAIESAAATLEFGGVNALQSLLENMNRHRVYAVDEQGHELLGRIVKPAMILEARRLLKQDGSRRVVREVRAANSHRYVLFLPSREHLGGMPGGGAPLLGSLASIANAPFDGRGPGHPRFPVDGRGPGGAGYGPEMWPRPGAPGQPGPDRRGPSGPMEAEAAAAAGSPAPGPGPQGPPPRFQPLTPFIPIAAAVLASLFFAALLAWYFARPIRSLRQAFEAASHGDLAPRFAQTAGKRGDELSDLGRDFDRMTARLRSLMDAQTRLLHDVSHELRSPLARLQAAIGLAHQQPDKAHATMERIERESVRMDKLVGELLTLARLESGPIKHGREQISMAELLDEIVADAEFEAASHDRAIELRGSADVAVNGQADLLASAIENIVRNAIKHSPAGGTVRVELDADEATDRLHIRVLDRGPGVAQADLQAIFEPFFRSSDTLKDVEGHGLGLAIAQQVVHAHGGSIAARNREDGGLCVEIALPIAQHDSEERV